MSIGIFDSGVGGLTVMRQIIDLLPHEDIIYFGDTARLPYGGKSKETIKRYCRENAAFLLEKNIKLLVIACNTATSHALEDLQEHLEIPVIGVIEAGVKSIVESTKSARIAILGTKGTIQSGVYQEGIQKALPQATLYPIACPLFVHFVEEQLIEHPATRLIVKEYLKPLIGQNIDTLMLGCTHYPLLQQLLQEEVGSDVFLVDSATTCAAHVKDVLQRQNIETNNKGIGTHHYFVSDDPQKFQELGCKFLKLPINQVTLHIKDNH